MRTTLEAKRDVERQGLQRGIRDQGRSSTVPPIVYEVLRSGGGRPLDDPIRAWMERRFGYDFSRVRIHADARSAESARAVNARAYTVGWDVVFGSLQYALSIRAGLRLLAHELAHVVQQTSRPVEDILGLGSMSISQPADRFERSADEAADAVIMGMKQASLALSDLPMGLVLQRDVERNIELNPFFVQRLDSVARELRGEGTSWWLRSSLAMNGTEYSLSAWRRFFDELFRTMYRRIGSFPTEVVHDAAWASAIYEWAARRPDEALDDWASHTWSGPRFSGEGASVGPFQGYASMSYTALQSRDTIRFLADSQFAQSDPGILRILSRVMDRRFTPGPRNSMWSGPPTPIGGDRWMRTAIRAELSHFDTLSGPVVSLIGKLQLSLRFAQRASNILEQCRLPDSVLRWVLLCYESHAENDRYVREVKKKFDQTPWGGLVSLEDLDPSEGTEVWDRRLSLRLVFAVLGIQFDERFRKTLLSRTP